MALRLYWSPDSANLVIRIALGLLDLPFQATRVNRGVAEHKSDAFLKLNPQGLLPVLTDDDIALFETGAILWHLMEKAGKFGPEGPSLTDAPANAAALKWMFYLSNTLHADLRVAFYTHRYVGGEAAITDLRSGLSRRIAGHCDLIEDTLDRGGLLGPTITIPDVYLMVCLRWAQIYPPGQVMLAGLTPWPRLTRLAERIEALPSVRQAFEAEFVPVDKALSAARVPDLSAEEVTGAI